MAFYFKQYILNMVYDTEYAYSLLDNEYREKRFNSYEKFESYVKDNLEEIEKSILRKYNIKEFEEYNEYVCRDNYNNYYIFKETEPMNYTVLLDQYTIEDKVFIEEYNKEEDNMKAQMNLELFKQMLNRKDFNSAYNVLNEDFKKKYFETEEGFEKYISENLFEFCEFTYVDFSLDEGKYKIKTEIKNSASNSNEENIVKRFKVELLEEKNFLVSFDI